MSFFDTVSVTNVDVDKIERLVENINIRFSALAHQLQQTQPSSARQTFENSDQDLCNEFQVSVSKLSHLSQTNNEAKGGGGGGAGGGGGNDGELILSPLGTVLSVPLMNNKNKQQQNKKTFLCERELFFAAYDLCMYLNGGVNYRSLCIRYHSVMELLLTMLKEEIAIVRELELGNVKSLEKIIKAASAVFTESREEFTKNGIFSQNNNKEGEGGGGEKERKKGGEGKEEGGDFDFVASLDVNKKININEPTVREYSLPATLPLTDTSTVNNNINIKNIVNNNLSGNTREKISDNNNNNNNKNNKFSDFKLLPLQKDKIMEVDCGYLQDTFNLPHRNNKIFVTMDELTSPLHVSSYGAEKSNDFVASPTSILRNKSKSSLMTASSAGGGSGKGGERENIRTNMSSTLTKSETFSDYNKSNSNDFVHCVNSQKISFPTPPPPPPPLPLPLPSSSSSLLLLGNLEEIYGELYQGDGKEMLNSVLEFIYFKEYEQGDYEQNKQQIFKEFKKQITNNIFSILQSYESFENLIKKEVTLSFEYKINCLRHHVKPNKNLLELLNGFNDKFKINSLIATNMKICDVDIKLFAPLLLKLNQLNFIDLSGNNIHDEGIKELCSYLLNHPSINSIDLSNNPFGNCGAEALLQLVTVTRGIKVVKYNDVNLSPYVSKKLEKELHRNNNNNNNSVTAAAGGGGGGLLATPYVFAPSTNNNSVTSNNKNNNNEGDCEGENKEKFYKNKLKTPSSCGCYDDKNKNNDDGVGKEICVKEQQAGLVLDPVSSVRQKPRRPYSNYGNYFRRTRSLASSSLRSVNKGVRLPYLTAKQGKSIN